MCVCVCVCVGVCVCVCVCVRACVLRDQVEKVRAGTFILTRRASAFLRPENSANLVKVSWLEVLRVYNAHHCRFDS